MSAKIIIKKKTGLFFRAASFAVYFDGKEVAQMLNTKTFVLEDAGLYAVQLKMKWLKTQTLIVSAEEGQETFLVIKNGLKYYAVLYWAFLISLVAVPMLFSLIKLQKPEWLISGQVLLALAFTFYSLFYFIFKRGEIWILEDANKKSR